MSTSQPPDSGSRPWEPPTTGGYAAGPFPQQPYQGVPGSGAYPVPPAGDTAPSSRRRTRVWPWLAGCASVLLLLCLVGAGLVFAFRGRILSGAQQAIAGPRDATTGYFDAVEAGDWPRARSYLNSSLRSANTPASLQVTWQRHAAANGALDRFVVTNVNIRTSPGSGGNTTTAVVSGTLHYKTGLPDPKVVNLVREGGDWKLASLP